MKDIDNIHVFGESLLSKDIEILRAGKKEQYRISSVTYKSNRSILVSDISNGWSQILYDYELKSLVNDGVCSHWEGNIQVFYKVTIDDKELVQVRHWLIGEAINVAYSSSKDHLIDSSIYFCIKAIVRTKQNTFLLIGSSDHDCVELSYSDIEKLVNDLELELFDLGITISIDYSYAWEDYNDEDDYDYSKLMENKEESYDMDNINLNIHSNFIKVKHNLEGKELCFVNHERAAFTISCIYQISETFVIEGDTFDKRLNVTADNLVDLYCGKETKVWDKSLMRHVRIKINALSIILPSKKEEKKDDDIKEDKSIDVLIRKLLRSKLWVTDSSFNDIAKFVIEDVLYRDKSFVVCGSKEADYYTFDSEQIKDLVNNKELNIGGLKYRLVFFTVSYDDTVDTFMKDFSFIFNCIKAIDLGHNRSIKTTCVESLKKINDLLGELKDDLKAQLLKLLNDE